MDDYPSSRAPAPDHRGKGKQSIYEDDSIGGNVSCAHQRSVERDLTGTIGEQCYEAVSAAVIPITSYGYIRLFKDAASLSTNIEHISPRRRKRIY